MKHYTWGGSTATRTRNCNGWIVASKGVPPHPPSDAAIEGSMHHEVQELCWKNDTVPDEYLGRIYEEGSHKREFTEDDLPLANAAYALADSVLEEFGIEEFFVEPFVEWVEGEVGGSIDLLGISEDRKIGMVLDYKFGTKAVGIDTDQLPFYAVSAINDAKMGKHFKDVETWVLVIIQPRGAGITKKSISANELEDFAVDMWLAIEASKGDNPKRNPGAWCAFCPAAPYCEAKRQKMHEATLITPENHNSLNAAAGMVAEVEEWLKRVKEEMYVQMNRGVNVEGWKIVEKQARRYWADEVAVVELAAENGILEDVMDHKLKSVAQAEKVFKSAGLADDLEEFVEKKSSGTTIAVESDKREAVVVTDIVGKLNDIMKPS